MYHIYIYMCMCIDVVPNIIYMYIHILLYNMVYLIIYHHRSSVSGAGSDQTSDPNPGFGWGKNHVKPHGLPTSQSSSRSGTTAYRGSVTAINSEYHELQLTTYHTYPISDKLFLNVFDE